MSLSRPVRLPALLGLAALLLAACAAPPQREGAPDASAAGSTAGPPPPGSNFALGDTGVPEVLPAPEELPELIGEWEGVFHPIDMASGAVSPAPAGRARLIVEAAEGSRLTGRAAWRFDDGRTETQRWTAARTRSGHLRIMNSRSYIHETPDYRYLDLDLQLSDGRFYRHRLVFLDG